MLKFQNFEFQIIIKIRKRVINRFAVKSQNLPSVKIILQTQIEITNLINCRKF
jgi:hypothetical protein